jgi:hypothetical protein
LARFETLAVRGIAGGFATNVHFFDRLGRVNANFILILTCITLYRPSLGTANASFGPHSFIGLLARMEMPLFVWWPVLFE